MKKIQILLWLAVICNATSYAQSTVCISFINKDSVYDFGAITEGDMPVYQFQIKNIGSVPLVITDIKGDDADLKFKWPGKSLKPGKKGIITVTYSPKDQSATGSFKSDIFITSTATQNPYPFMHISGTVVPSKGGSTSNSGSKQKSRGGRR